jgi:hypothetical protein
VDDLPTTLYRIGRAPEPLSLPPYEFCGHGRFDDPLLANGHSGPWYRVLYLGETRLACFLEVLQGFRPDFAYFARISALPDGDDDPDLPTDEIIIAGAKGVSARWLSGKAMQSITADPSDGWTDLRSLSLHESLRFELAEDLIDLGVQDFDLGTITGANRAVTQRVARYLYEDGTKAMRYVSRFGCEYSNVAFFEGAPSFPIEPAYPIDLLGDPDLANALQMFGLTLDSTS